MKKIFLQDIYSGNKILWKFSIIYESGILGVKVFFSVIMRLLSLKSDTIHAKQTNWEMYTPYDGAKGTSPSKNGKFTIGKEKLLLLS
jgi:hypothetical protein